MKRYYIWVVLVSFEGTIKIIIAWIDIFCWVGDLEIPNIGEVLQ
jgi:hypothetical protein